MINQETLCELFEDRVKGLKYDFTVGKYAVGTVLIRETQTTILDRINSLDQTFTDLNQLLEESDSELEEANRQYDDLETEFTKLKDRIIKSAKELEEK